jgi:spore maturation protein CgeB
MRIVIFGLTISSSWANGHATLWRGLCRAWAEQHHNVCFFEKDVSYYATHRDLTSTSGYELVLYSSWDSIQKMAKTAVHGCDAAVVTSYCPDAWAACDLILQSSAAVKIFYDLDTPVTIDRMRRKETVEYIPDYGLGAFDLVLSFTGGRALDELRSWLGARRVAPLYGSVDSGFYQPTAAEDHYCADLSYLGTYAADRQPTLNRLFLEPARKLRSKKFLIGGAQYPDNFPWADNVYFVSHVAPPQHPAFYSSSNATLSVTRSAMAEMGYCPSGRLFEAAACATPIISDSWPGVEDFFEPGREIFLASQPEDVSEVLHLPVWERQKVGAAARRRVLAHHTAEHRSQEFVSMVEDGA